MSTGETLEFRHELKVSRIHTNAPNIKKIPVKGGGEGVGVGREEGEDGYGLGGG